MTLLEGLGYVAVGFALSRRTVTSEWRTAALLFQAWWFLVGVNKLIAAALGIFWLSGWVGMEAYFAALYVNLLILCLSLGSLVAYFSFLIFGNRRGFPWLIAFYGAFYFLLTYNFAASDPSGVGVGTWRTFHIHGQTPVGQQLLIFAMLVLPQVVMAGIYASLSIRIHDRTSRFRILLVALSVVGWTGSIFMVSLPGFDSSAALQVGSRIVGLTGAAFAVLAYRPPRWLSHRLGLHPLVEVARTPPVEA